MHLTHNTIKDAVAKAMADKGKRKFKQTLEMAINFRGLDLKKPENRFNLDIALPNGRGKEIKILVFADGQMASEAKKAGVEVMSSEDIGRLAKDPKQLKKVAKESEFLADPKLMVVIGKQLGGMLGKIGRLPKPLLGDTKQAVETAKRTVRVATKGKYLPVVHAPVGTEDMDIEKIAENVEAVYDKVKNKAGEHNIKSVYVKLSMGKPVKIE